MCACACTYLCVMYVDAFLTFLSLCAVSEGCDTGGMDTYSVRMYSPTYLLLSLSLLLRMPLQYHNN